MSAAPRIDELIARLPGAIRRGHTLSDPGQAAFLATGIEDLERAPGRGLRRGRLSELVGVGSAGGTSLAVRLAAATTAKAELVAWVDAADALDPQSMVAVGVDLERLLWIRPPGELAGFSAAEQLLVLGGFPLVVLDTGALRRASSLPWLRLSRAAERSRSALLVLRRRDPGRSTVRGMRGDCAGDPSDGAVGPLAAIRLELPPARALWDRRAGVPCLLDGLLARVDVKRNRGGSGDRRVPVPLR